MSPARAADVLQELDAADPYDVVLVRGAVGDDGGVAPLLELLAALAEADSLGTGPGVWSPWGRLSEAVRSSCKPRRYHLAASRQF